MKINLSVLALNLAAFTVTAHSGLAQLTAPSVPQEDSSYVDPQGTAYVTRIVPMPTTVSPEAQKWLDSLNQQKVGPPESLAERRIQLGIGTTRGLGASSAAYTEADAAQRAAIAKVQ